MAKLILHRQDRRSAFQQSFQVYLNRISVGQISANQRVEFELKPGRYQISVGGFFAQEGVLWFELQAGEVVLEIQSTKNWNLKNFPKYKCLKIKRVEAASN